MKYFWENYDVYSGGNSFPQTKRQPKWDAQSITPFSLS